MSECLQSTAEKKGSSYRRTVVITNEFSERYLAVIIIYTLHRGKVYLWELFDKLTVGVSNGKLRVTLRQGVV